MSTAAREIERTVRESSEGADVLGYVVTWDVERIALPVADVRSMLLDSDVRVVTEDIRESGALLRALRELAEDDRVVQIGATRDEIVYALVQDERDLLAKRVRTNQRATITYLKRADAKRGEEAIVYEFDDPAQEIACRALVEHYKVSYTARDLTARILSPVTRRAGGTKMREQGGMYFVVAQGVDEIERLRTFVDLVAAASGSASHFTILPIPNGARERSDMRYHSHKAFVAEVTRLQSQLRDLMRPDRAGRVSPETVAGYIQKVREVGERAALYRDSMEIRTAEISTALRTLATAYQSVLTGDEHSIESLRREHLSAVADAITSAARVDAKLSASAVDDSDDPFALVEQIGSAQKTLDELVAQAHAEKATAKAARPARRSTRATAAATAQRAHDARDTAAAIAAAFAPESAETAERSDADADDSERDPFAL